jgi:hypothetical protein
MGNIHFSARDFLGLLKPEGNIKALGVTNRNCHRRYSFFDKFRRENLNSKEEEEK